MHPYDQVCWPPVLSIKMKRIAFQQPQSFQAYRVFREGE